MFTYGVVSVSIAPIRLAPNHRSEQVTQLLFGERLTILSQPKGAWIMVRNSWDNYEGWILISQFIEIPVELYRKNLTFYSLESRDMLSFPDHKGTMRLSPGSDLFLLKRDEIKWHNFPLTFKGKKVNRKKLCFSPENLKDKINIFMGTPYLWGGKSVHGIDCSGLSQMVFKMMGYRLPRDASKQAMLGETVHFLQDAVCGDLAFFDNEEGKINHVGILLDNKTIAHASESAGRVVIDTIDAEGIISNIHKTRTHKLRLINRYF